MMIDIETIVRANILAMKPYSSARSEYTGDEGIFLDANENPFGTLNRYPDPYQKVLKEKLASLKSVNSSNIFVGNGSDEVIDLAFRIFCNPGVDKAVTFTPTYGMYQVSAAINNVELITLPLNNEFQMDMDLITPFLSDSGAKIILICSPNNPTGNLMRREDVVFILENFRGIVLVDEAYIDFAAGESLVGLTASYNNLIVSQTFSKARGLAAARIGIAYASEKVVELFNKVKPPYNVSTLNQQAAIKALENSEFFDSAVANILSEKERLRAELQQVKVVKKIWPSNANFLLIEVEDADIIYAQLKAAGIIVRNRNREIANTLRVTVGTPEENDKLMKALKKI